MSDWIGIFHDPNKVVAVVFFTGVTICTIGKPSNHAWATPRFFLGGLLLNAAWTFGSDMRTRYLLQRSAAEFKLENLEWRVRAIENKTFT
jgi:hypothetical protein